MTAPFFTRVSFASVPTLQVVWVNYRAADLLAASVASTREAAAAVGGVDLELTVVDNSCDALEVERLRTELPADVRIVAAPENLGFARGCNLGAAHGRAEHLLFLNPDTLVLRATLQGLLATLADTRGRAILGPRHYVDRDLRFAHAPMRGVRLFDEAWDLWYDRGYGARRSLRDLAFRASLARSLQPVRLRSVSGGCLATSRTLFEALGGWDPRYFLYSEDTDLCVRARRRGVPVLYLAAVPLVHFVEGSARHAPARVAAARIAGRALFKRTHYGATLARLDHLATAALGRRLPRRRDRWRAAERLPTACTLHAPVPGRPWAVELGRSPLFDNCLTAFPAESELVVPMRLVDRLAAGTCFVRVAYQKRPGRWLETALYRRDRRPAEALQEVGS